MMETDPFSLGPSLTQLILYMASPNGLDDREGRRRWTRTMLLVTGKKMAEWSEVKKETGLVPAAEVVPYAWAHRFLPQESKKVSGGDDARGKMSLPWLHLVATGEEVTEFKWTRCGDEVTITEDGKRAVLFGSDDANGSVVAEPQVSQGRHWFEVQILDPVNHWLDIGWSVAGLEVEDPFEHDRGCGW